MKSLKQCIMKLPEIDGRWELQSTVYGGRCAQYGKKINGKCLWIFEDGRLNSIESLHAAAKTFGYEIGWRVNYIINGDAKYGYNKEYIGTCREDSFLAHEINIFGNKDIKVAVDKAFKGAFEHKLESMK